MSVQARDLQLIEGSLPVGESNFSVDGKGFTHITWGQAEAVSLKKGEVLFSIGNLPVGVGISQLISQDIENLYPEIYTGGLKNEKIELAPYINSAAGSSFESIVTPNPFSEITSLRVTILSGMEFVVSLYNIKGQELFNRTYVSYTLQAEIEIGSNIIEAPGIYYYRVKSSMGELTGKFIKQ